MCRQRVWLVLCAGILALQFASPAGAAWVTERLNLNRYGLQSNGGSWAPSMSADGRYVAWHSWATDLIVGDTDGVYDVYVRDRQEGVNYLVSRTSTGGLANNESLYPSITADGLSIAFSSEASNLVPGDTNGMPDIFVTDWTAGVIERVSIATTGEEANGLCDRASISGDGRFVSFESEASNLIPGGRAYRFIYLRDRLDQTTEPISVSSEGVLANNVSFRSAVSPDGRYVVFISAASNLVTGDTNGVRDIFLRDRATGSTERVSLADQTGAQGNADSSGPRPAVTPDGRFIAFASLASNLVAGDTNGVWDVFVRDRLNGTTERVSVSTAGVQGSGNSGADSYVLAMSDDGRYVEFCSQANNLVTGDTNGVWDVFVRDRQSGTTERQSVSSLGAQAEVMAGYYGLDMSADGSLRVFDSHANQLVPNDTSVCINTFLHFAADPPVSAFSAAPTSGPAPLAVQFTHACTGHATSCTWDFGDGGASSEESTVHTYVAVGTYTVGHTATNQYGSDTETKTGYISVAAAEYTLTVNADPAAGGVATGGGTYPDGTVVSVTATPAAGYTFGHWTGSVANPNAASTTVTMTGDLTIAAHFTVASHTLTANAEPAAGGAVTGGGVYPHGTVVSVTATPASGYTFANWTGPVANANAASTTVTVTGDLTVTAHFTVIPPATYTLTVSADPAAGGTVTGGGVYTQGTVASVTAVAASGYSFANWTGPVANANAASTTVTVTGNVTVTAHFSVIPPTMYSLATNADPAAGGVVTGGGSYLEGTVVQVTATPASGYTFGSWTGPVADASAASTTVTMTSDLTVTAHFAAIPPPGYTLTVSANPAAGGTVTGGGTYPQGTVVSVTATPAPGYFFANWTGPVANANAASTTVTMTGNLTVAARFFPVWLEDTDPPIVYAGAWALANKAIASAGHLKYSTQKNAQATLTFNGRGVSWHVMTGPAMGKARVAVDGGKPVVVDLYASSESPATIVTSGLTPGRHTLVIRVLGQRSPLSTGMMVTVDALEVTP